MKQWIWSKVYMWIKMLHHMNLTSSMDLLALLIDERLWVDASFHCGSRYTGQDGWVMLLLKQLSSLSPSHSSCDCWQRWSLYLIRSWTLPSLLHWVRNAVVMDVTTWRLLALTRAPDSKSACCSLVLCLAAARVSSSSICCQSIYWQCCSPVFGL